MTTILSILLAALLAAPLISPPRPFGPIPTPQQLKWQELEYYAFIHFNMNTFTDREWGDGKEDPKLFNPTQLDCRQWARTVKEAGMKAIILSAKHHDGFCLWPSKLTEHSVKNSPFRNGQGDIVKELAAACREYGLKLGIYLSPWDRHEPSYGDSPRYNGFFKNQLRELLTSYGDIYEVWFDGACGEGPNGKRQVYDWPGFVAVVRECQPNAVIFSDGGPDVRWMGNEKGIAGETNWSLLRRDEVYPGYEKAAELTLGHPDGTHWVPAESDVSIRPGWFYHAAQDTRVKSVKELSDIYFKSVGRNASLLLNLPVDRRGLIHENDVAALMGLQRFLQAAFANDLISKGTAKASNVRGGDKHYAAQNVLDGRQETYWCTDDGVTSSSLEVSVKQPIAINCLMLQEYIALGQRIESFSVDTWDGKGWKPVAAGTTIGYKRMLRFPEVTTAKLKISILKSRACPVISNLAAYQIPE
jgi:alpha-L-fucosidase